MDAIPPSRSLRESDDIALSFAVHVDRWMDDHSGPALASFDLIRSTGLLL